MHYHLSIIGQVQDEAKLQAVAVGTVCQSGRRPLLKRQLAVEEVVDMSYAVQAQWW